MPVQDRPPTVLSVPPQHTRCETFELRDRVSEACEAFIEGSPEEDDVDEEGGDGKEGRDNLGATLCDVM